jgi:hypothetical protein
MGNDVSWREEDVGQVRGGESVGDLKQKSLSVR